MISNRNFICWKRLMLFAVVFLVPSPLLSPVILHRPAVLYKVKKDQGLVQESYSLKGYWYYTVNRLIPSLRMFLYSTLEYSSWLKNAHKRKVRKGLWLLMQLDSKKESGRAKQGAARPPPPRPSQPRPSLYNFSSVVRFMIFAQRKSAKTPV